MTERELFNRAFVPATPTDTADPPRFGQPLELLRDCVVKSLRDFLTQSLTSDPRRRELPTVDKYSTVPTGFDPYDQVAMVVRKHPEVLERVPHIAVMAASGSEDRYLGTPIAALHQLPPRITATLPGPYVLSDGTTLVLRTAPLDAPTTSTLVLNEDRLETGTMASVSATDLASLINEIALYARAEVVEDDAGDEFLELRAGGIYASRTPNSIELDEDTDTEFLTATGLGRRGAGGAIVRGSETATLSSTAATFTAADVGRFIVLTYDLVAYATAGTVAGGVATLTVPTGHGFTAGMKIRTSGFSANATVPVIVSSVGATSIVFPLTVTDQSLGTGVVEGYGSRNAGRFEITAVDVTGAIATLENPAAFDETFSGRWFISLYDDWTNSDRPPLIRRTLGFSATLQVQVVASDEITRGELTDLLLTFFQIYLEEQNWSWMGRGDFEVEGADPAESYLIALRPPLQLAGEDEIARPNDGVDKVYLNSIQIGAHVEMYLDRVVLTPPDGEEGWIAEGWEFDEGLAESS